MVESRGDEVAVVARLARGERDAIVFVYRTHHSELRAFARRLLGDAMAAEDLLHDVFVSLPRAAARFRGGCSIKNYLIAIAVRHAHHHLRAARRRRAAERRLALEPRRGSARADAEMERSELAGLLSRALDTLSTPHRVAFVLCEVEERTSSEAAQMLGEKEGTIRARVYHAKRRLRAELASVVFPGRGFLGAPIEEER